jgi:hypothetical protein
MSDSRRTVVMFAVLLFAAFSGLFLFATGTYLAITRYWFVYTGLTPFGDAGFVTAQLECWRAGVDVYTVNPCDGGGRINVYPPLWLRLWFIPGGPAAGVPFALAIVGLFIASLSVLPKFERKSDIVLLLLAVGSPAVAYGVERGNVDLAVFALAAASIPCLERTVAWRAVGYALILFAALLKLYPAALLILAVRERPRVSNVLTAAALMVFVAYGWIWHDELVRMLHNIPQPRPEDDGLGGNRLAQGLVAAGGRLWHGLPTDFYAQRGLTMGTLGLLALGAAGVLRRLMRDGFADAFAVLTTREALCFVAGAALFCGCFITGASLPYREVVLLLTLPGLARLRRIPGLPRLVRATAWIVIGLLWSVPFGDALEGAFGAMTDAGWPLPTFAFWLGREVLWWWVFAVMIGGLVCFARQARAGSARTAVLVPMLAR